MKKNFFITLLLTLSFIFPAKDKQINRLNAEIERIYTQVINIDFSESFDSIDRLIEECNNIDYFEGEVELVAVKVTHAIANEKEELILDWVALYQSKLNESIRIGSNSKELHYEFILLLLNIFTDGFEYTRDGLINIARKAKMQKNAKVNAYALYLIYQHTPDDEERVQTSTQLDDLYLEHPQLKKTFTYIAYKQIEGMRIYQEAFQNSKVEEPPYDFSWTTPEIDILIGTHRILSDDIKFKNLKLLIIDEEHRFGVEDKDRLQSLSNQVHKLTLTATPIPRTLEQSLMGIRETSRIETPPENRLETLTYVGNIDESTIALAIQREISRGGQVFFVLNRIKELQVWMKKIKEVFPNLNHKLLHGQLSTNQIEQAMQDVWDKKVDVLFATTIVESGIDLPKVNTLITLRSELLGMSQLYQLKGRVGRRREQSFAYFFHNSNLSIDAELRLDAIKSTGQTATGYSLAMKDLQLRGSGSILGDIQSGFIANVGLNIFNKYVIDSIEGKTEDKSSILETEIKLDCYWGSSIPKSYIDADAERIDIYKRLEHSEPNKVDEIKNEIIDRFGNVPEITDNLFLTAKIRSILQAKKILRCKIKEFQLELFPIDLTEDLKLSIEKYDKKFIFRNKRLILNFQYSLTPESTFGLLASIL